jgi:hypothetical protein
METAETNLELPTKKKGILYVQQCICVWGKEAVEVV